MIFFWVWLQLTQVYSGVLSLTRECAHRPWQFRLLQQDHDRWQGSLDLYVGLALVYEVRPKFSLAISQMLNVWNIYPPWIIFVGKSR